MHASTGRALATALLTTLAVACSQGRQPPSAPPPDEAAPTGPSAETLDAVDECLEGLSAANRAAPADRARLIGAACSGACPGFAEVARVEPSQRTLILVEQCGYVCPRGARQIASAKASERGAEMVAGCGAAYYGIDERQADLLSPEWFIVQRVAAWLAELEPSLEGERKARLADVMVDVYLPLPYLAYLPPSSDPRERRPERIAVITEEGVSVGTEPVARLRGSGIELVGQLDAGEIDEAGAPTVLVDRKVPVSRLAAAIEERAEPVRLAVDWDGGTLAEHRVGVTATFRAGDANQPLFAYADTTTANDLTRALDDAPEDAEAVVLIPSKDEFSIGLIPGDSDEGLGIQGTGPGGSSSEYVESACDQLNLDCEDSGTIGGVIGGVGMGRAGTIGQGSGSGSGYGSGRSESRPRGSVRLAMQSVEGSMDKNIVRRVLRRNLSRFRFCYERELTEKPGLAGRVTLRFNIDQTGRPTRTRATPRPRRLQKIAACAEHHLGQIHFPHPEKGAVVVRASLQLVPR